MYKLLVPLLFIMGCTDDVTQNTAPVQSERVNPQLVELNSLMNKMVYVKDKKGLCYAVIPYRTTGGSIAYAMSNIPQNTCGE